LARIRADNTAVYLSAQKKVDPGQLVVMSYGETVSVGDNKTEAGRRKIAELKFLFIETLSVLAKREWPPR
jgi:hypothetical protein